MMNFISTILSKNTMHIRAHIFYFHLYGFQRDKLTDDNTN